MENIRYAHVIHSKLSQMNVLGRPREAPTIWCPQKSQNPPSNPHGRRPQIRTFGQGSSREFQKRKCLFQFFFAPSRFLHEGEVKYASVVN